MGTSGPLDEEAPTDGAGNTLVPVPRRRSVAVSRSVSIRDLAAPECWATEEEDAEPTEIVRPEALDRAAEWAEEIEDRGSVLDDELQASMSELVRSLPPMAVIIGPPKPEAPSVDSAGSEPEPAGGREGSWLVLLQLAVVAGIASVGALACSAWVAMSLW